MQAVRITDVKVLDAPMELVKGDVKAPSGVTGPGHARSPINHDGDNSLITLRYKLKDADIQVAEEPFEADGTKFNRGTFIIQGVAQADLDKAATELGLKAVALAAAPSVKTHPARAARVAILHQWTQHADRGLVAPGVRHLRRAVRLHRSRRRSKKTAEPARRSTT